jgi:hypothetical protein
MSELLLTLIAGAGAGYAICALINGVPFLPQGLWVVPIMYGAIFLLAIN